MGREIQKRKNRSSAAPKAVKPKSKKVLHKNPVMAANWDKSLTLSQNYKRLGLASKLNKHTGGIERKAEDVEQLQEGESLRTRKKDDGLSISSAKRPERFDVQEARIERDPVTGEMRVVGGEVEGRANPLGDALNDLDSDEEDEGASRVVWARLENQHGNIEPGSYVRGEGETEVVRDLEMRASMPTKKYVRKQPEGERLFIEALVRKHGNDVGRMARDIKVNYMQRSEGDLKKRIKKEATVAQLVLGHLATMVEAEVGVEVVMVEAAGMAVEVQEILFKNKVERKVLFDVLRSDPNYQALWQSAPFVTDLD
nr:hypothetical protein B0A51_00488 [Rachicladosporium sp. CCFEE 5018]